ncbi:MAG: methyltransferase domain-containing protein [Alphaproteobacteria bacterium]|nr:methyltransferase domain-containing protein [Alphaproteobacteria bacterium]
MSPTPFHALACPIDLSPLRPEGKSWVCPQNHSFDTAREKYVNLLPVQFKKTKAPGDSRQMLKARADFLQAGAYDFILDAVCAPIAGSMSRSSSDPFTVIDAGCGNGYYTSGLKSWLEKAGYGGAFSMLGYDISKEAILMAAKRFNGIAWAVATSKRIPVQEGSVDALVSIFSYPVFGEFRRVLKPAGMLVLVQPGPNHLIELKQRIYSAPKIKPGLQNNHGGLFMESDEIHISRRIAGLTRRNMADLVNMTPHAFMGSRQKIEEFLDNPGDSITADIFIRVLHPV